MFIDGICEVLGIVVGDSEFYEFWCEFLVLLKVCGLIGVYLVIFDVYVGLKVVVV